MAKPNLAVVKDWQAYIGESLAKTVESILESGKRVYEYQQASDEVSGGSDFSANMQAWFDMSPVTAHKWAEIGAHVQQLLPRGKSLPSSWTTIYELTKIPEPAWDEINLKVETTRKEMQRIVKAFKRAGVTLDESGNVVNSQLENFKEMMRQEELNKLSREGIEEEVKQMKGKRVAAPKLQKPCPDGSWETLEDAFEVCNGTKITEDDVMRILGIEREELIKPVLAHYSKQHHPDVGGSHEIMQFINHIRSLT